MTPQEFSDTYAVERAHTNSQKWDDMRARFGVDDLLPMWVADMEFKTPECVREALARRVEHGVFGYTIVPDSFYEAVIDWERTHHGFDVEKDWIRLSPGVVSALYWAISMYTEPGDAVAIMTPVYYPFSNAIRDCGRTLVTSDLAYDGETGVFTVDFEDFEKKIAENGVKLFILCSPHNPASRVWTEEELERMLEICERHDVLVVSDEIHHDLTFGGHEHIPTATVAGGKYAHRVVTACAASKTFNLATCLTSTIIIPDEGLRRTWDEFTNIYNHVEVNVFGITAVEAALRGGEQWYQDLKRLIEANAKTVERGLAEFPGVVVTPLEGTYLQFVNLRAYVPAERMHEFIQDRCKIAVDYGEWFGEGWDGFIRLNLGTTPQLVAKTVEILTSNLRAFIAEQA